jgi:hypothetical protein
VVSVNAVLPLNFLVLETSYSCLHSLISLRADSSMKQVRRRRKFTEIRFYFVIDVMMFNAMFTYSKEQEIKFSSLVFLLLHVIKSMQ